MSSAYQVEWWKAVAAALVVTLTTLASRRLFPTLRGAPFIGAVIGAAVLILGSYLSWKLEHR
jgi:uncharacterized membrane protein YeaQ/YmgE (transglycosylase-associated protein family)